MKNIIHRLDVTLNYLKV